MTFCGNSKVLLKFIKTIDFTYRSLPTSYFSVLFYQNRIQNIFLCSFSMIFVEFLRLNFPQVELSGGRLKGPARGGDKIRFFSALYLRAPEELDNKLGIWEYLNSEFYRFLNFFWSE